MANMTIQNVHSVRSTPPNDADMEHVKEYRKRVGENDDAIACYLPMGAGIATRYLVRPLSSLHYVHLVNLEVSRRYVIWIASTVWNGMRKESVHENDDVIASCYNLGGMWSWDCHKILVRSSLYTCM